jgi:glycine oxidase
MEPGLLPTILSNHETYLLQRESGTLVAGSSMENVGFERSVDTAIVEEIQRRAVRLLPALAGRQPSDSWNGMRPATEQGRPVVGRVGDTPVWTAYGHFRNGILLAPDTAETIVREFEGTGFGAA